MDKKYTHCAFCKKKFKNKDEVAISYAGGSDNTLHLDCLFNWLLEWNKTEWFDSYEDLVNELK